ncbi:hypothetical protein FOZ60_006168 [Perkinsus olseni]|uniref:Uncharacterized protein n=1 Tax=Perkinsus olseni TaxID=32597 RepID=A0A7J6NPF1_PEROL|nr:hypothetical protein FOZ60_006168 [Perkinsus olseni]
MSFKVEVSHFEHSGAKRFTQYPKVFFERSIFRASEIARPHGATVQYPKSLIMKWAAAVGLVVVVATSVVDEKLNLKPSGRKGDLPKDKFVKRESKSTGWMRMERVPLESSECFELRDYAISDEKVFDWASRMASYRFSAGPKLVDIYSPSESGVEVAIGGEMVKLERVG